MCFRIPARIRSAAAKAATTAQLSRDSSQFFFAGAEAAGAESAACEVAAVDFAVVDSAALAEIVFVAVLMVDAPLG